MNKKIILASALLAPILISAAVPPGEPFAQFKSMRPLREKESERYVRLYVKSTTVPKDVYIQIGGNSNVDTLTITKADYITSFEKKNLNQDQMDIKLWADSTVWFLNINNDDAYDLQLSRTALENIKEFRAENDSLANLDFVNDMKKLEYLVVNGNKRVKKLDLKSNTLQRCMLNKLVSLEAFTIDAPEVYEFRLEETSIPSADFSKCPKLKTFTFLNNSNVASFNFGPTKDLATVQMSGCNKLESIEVKDRPNLTQLNIFECPMLSEVRLGDLPLLSSLTLRALNLKNFKLTGLPALKTANIGENPYESLDIDQPTITNLTLNAFPQKEVDLTKLPVVSTISIQGGEVENVKFNDDALQNTIKIMYLWNNAIPLANFPARPKNMNTVLNYYAPQKQPVLPSSIEENQPLDLSLWSKAREGDGYTPAKVRWITIFEEELEKGKDYTEENGIYTFSHEIEDSVRCYISHTAYPYFAAGVKDNKNQVQDWRILSNYMVVKKTGSGVKTAMSDNENIRIYGNGQAIIIESLEKIPAAVYTIDGICVYEGLKREIPLPKGLYVVKAGRRTSKVKL